MKNTAKIAFSALMIGAIFIYQNKQETSQKQTIEGTITSEETVTRVFPNYPVHVYNIRRDGSDEIHRAVFEPQQDLYNVGDKVRFTLGLKVQQTYENGMHGRRILESDRL